MKHIAALLLLVLVLLVLGTAAGFAQSPSATAETKLSPAERNMAQAKKLIYTRMFEVLSTRFSSQDRQAVIEILRETKKDLPL